MATHQHQKLWDVQSIFWDHVKNGGIREWSDSVVLPSQSDQYPEIFNNERQALSVFSSMIEFIRKDVVFDSVVFYRYKGVLRDGDRCDVIKWKRETRTTQEFLESLVEHKFQFRQLCWLKHNPILSDIPFCLTFRVE